MTDPVRLFGCMVCGVLRKHGRGADLGWTPRAIRGKWASPSASRAMARLEVGQAGGLTNVIGKKRVRQGGQRMSKLRYDPAHRPWPVGTGPSRRRVPGERSRRIEDSAGMAQRATREASPFLS